MTLHDGQGKALHTIRYGCMPAGDEQTLVMGRADDVAAMRRKRPDLQVSLLADGAAENWALLETEFDDVATFGKVTSTIDFWQDIEKLGAAAKIIAGDDTKATVKRWKLRLLNCNAASDEILAVKGAQPDRQVARTALRIGPSVRRE
ncbi:MAG: hypothetical protein ACOC1F_03610 [Myxococcota bacterium]